MNVERGKIRNRQFAQQLRDFSGMRWGNITPTDIDGFVEFGDDVFIFFEVKHGNTPLQGGQRLALERLVDVVGEHRRGLLIVGTSDAPVDEDVNFANVVVREYRFEGRWYLPQKEILMKTLADAFLKSKRTKGMV